MRLRLDLSYDGAPFSGFQVQKNAPSVQGELCRALRILCREEVPVSGCSRTDAGVHARHFVCHADVPDASLKPSFLKSVNALLPEAISVHRVQAVSPDFHARYSAVSKTYRYYVVNRQERAPLTAQRALHVREALDLDAMRRAASALCGTHDFAAFQAAGSAQKDTVRTVFRCEILEEGAGIFCFEISADGFLYRMVRNITGTLLDIGRGKDLDVPALLKGKDRTRAGRCAPPHGLYLWQVDYPEEG